MLFRAYTKAIFQSSSICNHSCLFLTCFLSNILYTAQSHCTNDSDCNASSKVTGCPSHQVPAKLSDRKLICLPKLSQAGVVGSTKKTFLDSNWKSLDDFIALVKFNFSGSLVFYLVVGFTVIMIFVAVWSVLKDRALNRDLWELPNRKPSWLYKIVTYIVVTHTFFNIFVLFEKERPRIMRSVLFYTRILGMMALSALFMQNTDRNFKQKVALAIVTTMSITMINIAIGYLVFKRNIKPKLRRKRLMNFLNNHNNNQNVREEETATTSKHSKSDSSDHKFLTKVLNYVGYLILLFIIGGYIYVILVVTAVNSETQDGAHNVKKWLLDFLQPIMIDFFIIQTSKVIIHMFVIYLLKSRDKKKFLCFSRKGISKMINPTVFDYQKRFAALERLYGDSTADNYVENLGVLPDQGNDDLSPSLKLPIEAPSIVVQKPQRMMHVSSDQDISRPRAPQPVSRGPSREMMLTHSASKLEVPQESFPKCLVRDRTISQGSGELKLKRREAVPSNPIRDMIIKQGVVNTLQVPGGKETKFSRERGQTKSAAEPGLQEISLDDKAQDILKSQRSRKAGMLEIEKEDLLRAEIMSQNKEGSEIKRTGLRNHVRERIIRNRRKFDV